MPRVYNWRIKRSGAGLRISGTYVFADGTIKRDHKESNFGAIEIDDFGHIIARDRNTGEVTAKLHPIKVAVGAFA